tara:strand:+ start:56 stop:721 length:666 start_codon:yes stop_codon:yes gene_type:complete
MRYLLIVVFALQSTGLILAQSKIEIEEKNMKMSQGVQNGLSVFIPAAEIKMLEKAWKKKVKEMKGKTTKVKDDLVAMGISMYNISDNTVNIYVNCKNALNGSQFNIFFDMGESYLSSYMHSDPYKSAERFCYNFALETAKTALEIKVKEADKSYKKTSDELDYLKSSLDKLEKNIERWSQQIEKAKEDIGKNQKEQSEKRDALSKKEFELQKAQKNLKNIK